MERHRKKQKMNKSETEEYSLFFIIIFHINRLEALIVGQRRRYIVDATSTTVD